MAKNLPNHVAVIMDGNRRWAAAREIPEKLGHDAGAENLELAVKTAIKLGVKYLTVFTLSTENVEQRSKLELAFLFSLMGKMIKEKVPTLEENGVRLNVIGDLKVLPQSLQRSFAQAVDKLAKNKKLTLTLALNYGGREEIVEAVRKISKEAKNIQEVDIEQNLYTENIPDPDLIIRTGGRRRLSNFLIWQSSYSEFFFTDTLWPDFGEKEFKRILGEYSNIVRNFGR